MSVLISMEVVNKIVLITLALFLVLVAKVTLYQRTEHVMVLIFLTKHYCLINVSLFTDNDECAMLNGGCEQICDNFEGSFMCSCMVGYILEEDNVHCRGN